ncbi:MAG: addiction module protein [Fimbriiglobus sp.]
MAVSLEQYGLDRLPPEDRLVLLGLLWDSLDVPPPIPEWHIRELERRLADAEANPQPGIPWEEFKVEFLGPR